MRAQILIISVSMVVLWGCVGSINVAGPGLTVVPYPAGCATYGMSRERCDAVVAEAKGEAEIGDQAVASIELTSEPPCDPGGTGGLCTYTTGFAANVRFHLADGKVLDKQIRCSVGGEYTILCTEHPKIQIGGPVFDGVGYRDVPCADENGGGCATPLPTIEPSAAADARSLDVPVLDVPIDHLGVYVIEAGHAILPNGILSSARFELADPAPTTFAVDPDLGLSLELRSLEPDGRPFGNYYDHRWRSGTEEVVVTLRFDVTSFKPDAVLGIRHLVVE